MQMVTEAGARALHSLQGGRNQSLEVDLVEQVARGFGCYGVAGVTLLRTGRWRDRGLWYWVRALPS